MKKGSGGSYVPTSCGLRVSLIGMLPSHASFRTTLSCVRVRNLTLHHTVDRLNMNDRKSTRCNNDTRTRDPCAALRT